MKNDTYIFCRHTKLATSTNAILAGVAQQIA